jgi:hypothetical protein
VWICNCDGAVGILRQLRAMTSDGNMNGSCLLKATAAFMKLTAVMTVERATGSRQLKTIIRRKAA